MATTKYNFSDGEDILLGTNSETIADGTLPSGANVGTGTTLSDGSVVKVVNNALVDTLGSGITSVTDNSSHDDIIYGNKLNDTFTMNGSGSYTIYGGNGNNTFNVEGSGNVKVYTGNGADTINLDGSGNYTVYGQNSSDKITVNGSGSSTIFGGNSGDTITVKAIGTGTDTILGGNGKDLLDAHLSTNNDLLYGGNGTDAIKGGAGTDLVIGGLGGDVLYSHNGGAADAGATFAYFTNSLGQASDSPFVLGAPGTINPSNPLTWGITWDVIVNFNGCSTGGNDILDFQNSHTTVAGVNVDNSTSYNLVGAETGPGWTGAFVWLGTLTGSDGTDAAAGTVNAGHAHAVWQDSGDNFVYADVNGDGKADLKIQVGEKLDLCDFHGVVTDPWSGGKDFTGTTDEDSTTSVSFGDYFLPPNSGDTTTVTTSPTTSDDGATLTPVFDGSGNLISVTYDPTTNPFFETIQVDNTGHGSIDDTFSYVVTDLYGHTHTANVDVTVTVYDLGPTADNGTNSTDEDTPISDGSVAGLVTPYQPDDDQLTFSGPAGGHSAHGALVTVNADGSYTYDTNAAADFEHLQVGHTLDDTFSYTVTDNHGASTTATVTVTVGVDDPGPSLSTPNVTGDDLVGSTLSASESTVTVDDDDKPYLTDTVHYQWERSADGVSGWDNISGATDSTYTLTSDDLGKYVRVEESFTDNHGAVGTADSSASDQITDGSTPPSGPTAHTDNWVVSNATKFVVPDTWMTWNDTGTNPGDHLVVEGISGLPGSWHTDPSSLSSSTPLIEIDVDSSTQKDFTFSYTLLDTDTGDTDTGVVNVHIVQPTGNGTDDNFDLSGLTYDHSYIDMKNGSDTGTLNTAQANNIVGGSGADTIYGVDGTLDHFIYFGTSDSSATYHQNGNSPGEIEHEGRDSIYNFVSGEDKIDLVSLGSLTSAGDLGSGTTLAAGQFGWKSDGANTDLYVNASGSAETITDGVGYNVDMEIHLVGNPTLAATDILHI